MLFAFLLLVGQFIWPLLLIAIVVGPLLLRARLFRGAAVNSKNPEVRRRDSAEFIESEFIDDADEDE